MPIRRFRSKPGLVFLPDNARYNQFLLAEFKITDELIERFQTDEEPDKFKPFQLFYRALAEQVFTVCEENEITNVHFIANGKLPRVRFNEEVRNWQSDQQLRIYYNPELHQCYKSHYDGAVRAKKISILFLANGTDIRTNAASFHQKVRKTVESLIEATGIDQDKVRIRDHQHLTYDFFAKEKGVESNNSHGLRLIRNRYKATGFNLPENVDTISYVVASIPVTRKMLKSSNINLVKTDSYGEFYQKLYDVFIESSNEKKLTEGAFIANGLTPVVRNSTKKPMQEVGELQMLGFDLSEPRSEFFKAWEDDKLVDYIHLIFAATEKDIEDKGFGKFVSNVDKVLQLGADKLKMTSKTDDVKVRFHQHIAYNFNEK